MTRQSVTHLPIEQLTAHPGNVRHEVGDLSELALSIREHGILQPLTVTEGPDATFLLIAGHRRLGAAVQAGLSRVPVVIRHDVTDEGEQLVLMLVENCQRVDLNPVEKAEAFGALRNRGLTVAEIARQVGVSAGTVYHYLALLELDDDERVELRRGNFTTADAMTMVRNQRLAQRKHTGGGTRGRPKGSKTTPWFSDRHPLAKAVRGLCDHRGRPKVGAVGCGPCWEQVIREAAGATDYVPDVLQVDEAIVERVLAGDYKARCNPAEKSVILRRWTAGGRHVNELARLTGWKPERYFLVSDLLDSDQEAS